MCSCLTAISLINVSVMWQPITRVWSNVAAAHSINICFLVRPRTKAFWTLPWKNALRSLTFTGTLYKEDNHKIWWGTRWCSQYNHGFLWALRWILYLANWVYCSKRTFCSALLVGNIKFDCTVPLSVLLLVLLLNMRDHFKIQRTVA